MSLKPAGALALMAVLLLSLSSSAAAQPAQSHPLSEIVPIDTDLNMEDYAVRNVSELVLNQGTEAEGLLLDDLTITHEGRAQKLVLDYQNNEWRIEDSNLDMNGNNITGFFGNVCPTGEFAVDIANDGTIRCISPTTELDDHYVNRAGDTMNGSLDMRSNPLLGLNRLETSGSGVTVTDSGNNNNLLSVSESGNVDLFAGDLGGVRDLSLVGSGNNDQYTISYDGTNAQLQIAEGGEEVLRIDDSTGNLILPAGGLDMQNSNLLNFFGAACPEGDVMVQVNSDGSFGCVDATNEVQQDFVDRSGDTMTGNLDMQGNNIIAPGEVNGVNITNPGNAITINGNQYAIPSNAIQTDELDESASYSLDWSNLAVQQSDITVADLGAADANLDMNGYNVNNPGSINNYFGSACPSGEVMADVGDDGTFGCVSIDNEIQDTYVNRAGDTMTGNLGMGGNRIQNIGSSGANFRSSGSLDLEGQSVLNTNQIISSSDSLARVQFSNGVDLEVGNGGGTRIDALRTENGGNVAIPNGNLDMGGNSITSFFGSACPSGEVVADVNNDGTFGCVNIDSEIQDTYVNRAGDTMTGTLDMQNNPLINIDWANSDDGSGSGLDADQLDGVERSNLNWGDMAISQSDITVADLGPADANLDMNGNSITNHYGSACPSGEVVADVNNDGTFGCVNIDSEIQDTYVNRAGDTMTGDLNMQDNNLDNVRELNLNPDGSNSDIRSADELFFNTGGRSSRYRFFSADGGGNQMETFDIQSDGNVQIPNGNLDMSGNSITNYFGSACPSGEVVADVNDDGTFGCVNIDNEIQDTYVNRGGDTMQGTLDMNGNTLTDTTGTLTLGGGDVSVPSGNIYNGQLNTISSWPTLLFNAEHAGSDTVYSSDDSAFSIMQEQNDDELEIRYASSGTQGNTVSSSPGIRLDTSGNVQIPNGNLNIGGGAIRQNVDNLNTFDGAIRIDRSGQHFINRDPNWDSGDFFTYRTAGGSGTGSIAFAYKDNSAGTNNEVINMQGNGNVGIPSGNLNMNGNSITNFFGGACSSGNVAVHLNDDGTIDCVDATSEVQDDFVNRGGDTMTGSLDMQGNNIISPGLVDGIDVGSQGNALTEDGSNRIAVASNSISVTELAEGDVDDRYVQLSGDVMSGSLDMNGNSITSFFGSACPSGEVVVDVNSDGSYDCTSLDNEVQDTYVNRAGDTMTGSLDMQNNNIDQVGTINSGGTTLNAGGDVVSSGTVEASADLKTGSGTVTSSSEMCIGNQC